jgi:uncharacterized protein (UPF0335 family)
MIPAITHGERPKRMNLDALKEKLGDETFGQLKTYVDDLTGQRDAARQESIDGRKKMKAELEQLRQTKATLFEKLGLDDDADLETLPEVKGQAEAAKQFEQRIKRLEREKADAMQRAGEIEGKYKGSRLDAALAKAISAHEFIDSDLVASHIASRATWEDDQILFRDGDKLMPLEDGVKAFAATKPHLLKATGARGSGHPPGAGSAGKISMTRNEFDALDPAARMAAVKEGVSIS